MADDPMPDGSAPRESKSIAPQPRAAVESQPWWANSQMRWSLTIIVGGVTVFLHSFGLIPALSEEKVTGIVGLIMSGGGAYWMIRRIKFGNDTKSPAAKITIT